jgi:hypothetical protein
VDLDFEVCNSVVVFAHDLRRVFFRELASLLRENVPNSFLHDEALNPAESCKIPKNATKNYGIKLK